MRMPRSRFNIKTAVDVGSDVAVVCLCFYWYGGAWACCAATPHIVGRFCAWMGWVRPDPIQGGDHPSPMPNTPIWVHLDNRLNVSRVRRR